MISKLLVRLGIWLVETFGVTHGVTYTVIPGRLNPPKPQADYFKNETYKRALKACLDPAKPPTYAQAQAIQILKNATKEYKQ